MTQKKINHILLLLAIPTILLTVPGCTSFLSAIMYAAGADLQPAEYEQLENQRTAVIVVTEGSKYTDDVTSRILSREVREILEVEVDKIKLVREEEIDSWKDTNGWDQLDFVSIGKGLKADKVVAIELTGLKLREGQTLYRGRANVTTTVYDIQTGRKEFRRHLDDFMFPVTAGQYTSETTEARFRRNFLMILAKRVSRYFHRFDPKDSFALDAAIVNL